MQEKIREAVKDSKTLNDVKHSLFDVFKKFREEGFTKIGYVSGMVTSEGPEHIQKNIKRLANFTDHIKQGADFPIFSATDVFDDELFTSLEAAGFANEDWIEFWRQVLGSDEKFVTDMFMTPRWEKSKGATDEHETAQVMKMEIHYIIEEI